MILFYTKLKKNYESSFAYRIGSSVVNVPFIIRPLQFGIVSLQAPDSDWSVEF